MEKFASDGGSIHLEYQTVENTSRFFSDTANLSALWYLRTKSVAVPIISSGGLISVLGYPSSPSPAGSSASHEMLYKIWRNPEATEISISVPDTGGFRYYLVIPNDDWFDGAKLYPMKKGVTNRLNTYGKDVYLYAVTQFAGVLTPVTFSWSPPPADKISLRPGSTLIADARGFLFGVTDRVALEALLAAFNDHAKLHVVNADGSPFTGEYVGTGCRVQLRSDDGAVLDEMTVVVLGDVTGSGTITPTDYSRVAGAYLGTYTLTGAYFFAADVTGTGDVNPTDYSRIAGHYMGAFDLYSN